MSASRGATSHHQGGPDAQDAALCPARLRHVAVLARHERACAGSDPLL